MRLENFIINEASEEETLQQFLKETKQYRDMMKGVRLWRGHNKKIDGIKKFTARKDRQPKDTPKEVHEWLDKFFKQNFGWKARSEGVFAAAMPNGIEHFGKYVDLIYPCNGFKFVYASNIQDLTAWLEDEGYIEQVSGNKWEPTGFNHDGMRMNLLKRLTQEYTDKNLPNASWGGVEVMLNCPNGYWLLGGGGWLQKYYDEIEGDYR